jgi:Uncharacterized protein conserved in bacteria (DUF2188)
VYIWIQAICPMDCSEIFGITNRIKLIKNQTSTLKNRMAEATRTKSGIVHLTARPDGWVLKKEGNKRASSGVVKTQKDVISAANRLVKQGKAFAVVVHGKDGKIRN